MKKLFLALTVICVSVACKKETSTTNSNTNGITNDTTKTTNQPTSGFGPNIKDIEGNSYKTVYIGTQQWMAENLKVTKYNDGSNIPNVDFLPAWNSLTSGAWAYYSSVTANNDKYGKLYNWYVVSKVLNGNKNVCPTGWRVPTDSEWAILTDYLGGDNVAGGKMKEAGLLSWKDHPNIVATNSSLFTALPGGYRYENNFSDILGQIGYWWSSSEYDAGKAKSFTLYYNSNSSSRYYNNKGHGLSIRCIKD
jgi:uncharacterized protein (TIGR02145 family)